MKKKPKLLMETLRRPSLFEDENTQGDAVMKTVTISGVTTPMEIPRTSDPVIGQNKDTQQLKE
jgi:hypothetical protein